MDRKCQSGKRWPPEGQPDPTTRDPREPSRSEPRKANRIHVCQPDRTTLIIAAGGEESKCCNTQTRACHETREHLFTPSGATFSFGCSAAITRGRRDAPTWMQQAEETDGGKKPVLSTWKGTELVQHTEILQYLRSWQDFG